MKQSAGRIFERYFWLNEGENKNIRQPDSEKSKLERNMGLRVTDFCPHAPLREISGSIWYRFCLEDVQTQPFAELHIHLIPKIAVWDTCVWCLGTLFSRMQETGQPSQRQDQLRAERWQDPLYFVVRWRFWSQERRSYTLRLWPRHGRPVEQSPDCTTSSLCQ